MPAFFLLREGDISCHMSKKQAKVLAANEIINGCERKEMMNSVKNLEAAGTAGTS